MQSLFLEKENDLEPQVSPRSSLSVQYLDPNQVLTVPVKRGKFFCLEHLSLAFEVATMCEKFSQREKYILLCLGCVPLRLPHELSTAMYLGYDSLKQLAHNREHGLPDGWRWGGESDCFYYPGQAETENKRASKGGYRRTKGKKVKASPRRISAAERRKRALRHLGKPDL